MDLPTTTKRECLLSLAIAAKVHQVTAAKFLRGEPVRGDAGARLVHAARELGIALNATNAQSVTAA